jgi:hypothetical protein
MNSTISEMQDGISKGRPPNFHMDAATQYVLNRNPGALMWEVGKDLRLAASTVFYVLTNRMEHRSRKCRIAPHTLSQIRRYGRFQQSCKLLQEFQVAKQIHWKFIFTEASLGFLCQRSSKTGGSSR